MEQVIAETMLSEKGKKLLIVNNYKFSRASTDKSGKIRWRCRNAKCTARIYSLTTQEENVVEQKGDHNHPSDPTLSRQAVNNSLKRKAVDGIMIRPTELIHLELETNKFSHDIIKDDFKRFRRNMSRLRSKSIPFAIRDQAEIIETVNPLEEPMIEQMHNCIKVVHEDNQRTEAEAEHVRLMDEVLLQQIKAEPLHCDEVQEDRAPPFHCQGDDLVDQVEHHKIISHPPKEEKDIIELSNGDIEDTVIAESMLSEKGKKLLILNNYKFARASTSKSGKIRWRCCNAKCTARIYSLTTEEENIVEQKGDHDHPSDPTLPRQAVSNSLKRKAIDGIMIRPTELIHLELETNKFSHNIIKDDFKRFRQNMYRLRSKSIPFAFRDQAEIIETLNPLEEPMIEQVHNCIEVVYEDHQRTEAEAEHVRLTDELLLRQIKAEPLHCDEVQEEHHCQGDDLADQVEHDKNISPLPKEEKDIIEPSNGDIEDTVIAETTLCEKGKKLLILDNYKFARASTSKSGKIRWKCYNAKCTARIYSLTTEEENIVEQEGDHNHSSDPTLPRQAVSRKAIDGIMIRPTELIHLDLETNKFSHDIKQVQNCSIKIVHEEGGQRTEAEAEHVRLTDEVLLQQIKAEPLHCDAVQEEDHCQGDDLVDQAEHDKSISPLPKEEKDIIEPSNGDNTVIAETMLSEKGRKLLILNNYKFARASTSKIGKIRWKCCNTKCTARIYSMTFEEERVVEQRGDHSHASDSTLSRQAVSNSLKRKAIDDLMVRPAKLIHSELEANKFSRDIIKDDIKRMRKNMYCARRKIMPFFSGVQLHQYYLKVLGEDWNDNAAPVNE